MTDTQLLSPADARQIDQTCDRFEAAWKAGSRPDPAEFLGAAAGPVRSALLRQLLLLDWDYRRRAGENPRAGDYHTRFPDNSTLIEDVGREMARPLDSNGIGPGGTRDWHTLCSGGRTPDPPGKVAGVETDTDRYDLVQEVGHGGIGVVFRGRDRVLGRELAVKVLREAYRDKPEARRRLTEEARVGSQLQHPAIVPVYELGSFGDGRPYFTMKLVEGHTLAALLQDRPDPGRDLPRWMGIFGQVCQAMAYAHARGVVHRDLKPANVMVGAFGEVQVMDWGFAKLLGGDGIPPDDATAPASTSSALGGQNGTTHSGVLMGTPAYMPPEQARGEAALIDPRADVFALGAILCEILTGRPPYAGDADEVCRKAAGGELADARARLDACAADGALPELARRCLAAERDSRPADAGVVARELTAYLTSAQERLRQAQLERAAAEARAQEAGAKAKAERRARQLTLALAAASAVLLVSGAAGWWWYDHVRQAQAFQVATTDGKVEAALAEAESHVNRRDWPRATAAVIRARELLGSGASDHWKARLDELLADLDLVAQIDENRQLQSTFDFVGKRFPREEAMPRYAEAFARYGIRPGDDPARVVSRITQRPNPVQEAVVAGLDNWWLIARGHDATTHDWLGAVLQAADADGWRAQVRRAVVQKDRHPLEELAGKEDLAIQSPAAVASLSWALLELKAYDTVISLLRPAQLRYPNDFWINRDLAHALLLRRPANYTEALRFFSIAWALRPEQHSPATYINLGRLFIEQKDWDGAIFVSRKLLELQPDSADAYNHLGMGLAGKGDWPGAEKAYRKAIELMSDDHASYCNLGKSLLIRGQADEATACFRQAVRLRPDAAGFHFNLGNAEYVREDFDAALAAYDQAIAKDPNLAVAHLGRGHALLAKSRLAHALHERLDVEQGRGVPQAAKTQLGPALAAYERAIRLDPTMDRAHSSLGLVWLLVGNTDRAVAACRRAVELNSRTASNHCNLGRALEAAKARDEAIASYREAVRLDRDYAEAYCHLHRVLRDTGRFVEALAAIEEGHRLGSARPRWRLRSLAWLKETQQDVELEAKLPGILNGSEKPGTPREQLNYAWVCQRKGLYGAAAHLHADAFVADPTLVNSPSARLRYRAAQAAALAGTTEGRDDPKPDAAERARWRKQALDWLRADLTLLADRMGKSPDNSSAAQGTLQFWRRDKTLAGIREPEELAKLPEPERADYIRFWSEVQELLIRCLASSKVN